MCCDGWCGGYYLVGGMVLVVLGVLLMIVGYLLWKVVEFRWSREVGSVGFGLLVVALCWWLLGL